MKFLIVVTTAPLLFPNLRLWVAVAAKTATMDDYVHRRKALNESSFEYPTGYNPQAEAMADLFQEREKAYSTIHPSP